MTRTELFQKIMAPTIANVVNQFVVSRAISLGFANALIYRFFGL
jgi:hypothetical protein